MDTSDELFLATEGTDFEKKYRRLLKSTKFGDVELKIKFPGKIQHVRGDEFLLKSEYFKLLALYSSEQLKSLQYPENLAECFSDLTLLVIEFIRGEDKIGDLLDADNVLEVYIIADYLAIPDLIDICDEKAQSFLTPDNITSNIALVEKLPVLNKKLISYAASVFEKGLSKDANLGQLTQSSFEELLSHGNLKVSSETSVWEAILNWGSGKDKTIVADLVFKHVRLGLVGHSKFVEVKSWLEEIANVDMDAQRELETILEFQDWKHAPSNFSFLFDDPLKIDRRYTTPRETGRGILISGGWTAVDGGTVVSKRMELFDLTTMTWIRLPPCMDMFQPRGYHRLAVIDNNVFVLGGQSPNGKETVSRVSTSTT